MGIDTMSKEYEYEVTVSYGGRKGDTFFMGGEKYTIIAPDEETAIKDVLEYIDDDSYEVTKVVCLGEVEDE
jgi:hypothetical protein